MDHCIPFHKSKYKLIGVVDTLVADILAGKNEQFSQEHENFKNFDSELPFNLCGLLLNKCDGLVTAEQEKYAELLGPIDAILFY